MNGNITVSLSFVDFLTALDNRTGAKAKLEYVFGTARENLDHFRPSRDQTAQFIDRLKIAVEEQDGKDSAKKRARIEALDLALTFNATAADTTSLRWFDWVDPHVFAFQLALRVREPSLINQESTSLCGVVSVMGRYAKEQPREYARLAIDLLTDGAGDFWRLRLVLLREHAQAYSWDPSLPAVDLVTLGGFAIAAGGEVFRCGAWPPTVCAWLRGAGYTSVQDCCYLDPATAMQDRRGNLINAQAAIRAGRLVIMLSSTALAQVLAADFAEEALRASQEFIQPDAFLRKLHWTAVSRLQLDDNIVSVKFHSWAQSVNRSLPEDLFLPNYGGHIAAAPPQPPPADYQAPPVSQEEPTEEP